MNDSNGDPQRSSPLGRWFPPRRRTVPAGAGDPGAAQPAEIERVSKRRGGPARPGQASRLTSLVTIGLAVLLVGVAGGVLAYRQAHQGTTITAYFTRAIGVYPGSDVRILGVKVGSVDATQPDGRLVKVTLTLDSGIPAPADAHAVVVTDSVVADRYIQLTPAYTSGPRLADGAVIPVSRTAVPVEVDQIYASLSKFFTALGPNGFNAHGALSNLISTGANVLRGNGANLSAMLTQFSALNRLLGNTSADFFATVANLHGFSGMLQHNDAQVRLAEEELASVTGFFASDRQNLAAALSQLATALSQVQAFIAANRALIKSNVDKLAAITALLSAERASLAEALSSAPLALDNLLSAYDSTTRTLDGRGDLNELSLGAAAKLLGAASLLPPDAVPVPAAALAALPPLPLPAVGTIYGTPQALLAGGTR